MRLITFVLFSMILDESIAKHFRGLIRVASLALMCIAPPYRPSLNIVSTRGEVTILGIAWSSTSEAERSMMSSPNPEPEPSMVSALCLVLFEDVSCPALGLMV